VLVLDVLGVAGACRCRKEAPAAVGGRRGNHCSLARGASDVGCSQHFGASLCGGHRRNLGGVHGPCAAGSCWAMRGSVGVCDCVVCRQAGVCVCVCVSDAKQVESVDEHLRSSGGVPGRRG
jgi:hypothetical protein